MNIDNSQIAATQDLSETTVRAEWAKPEITDFQPVTVARGISYKIGDGISNLT